MIRDNLYLKRKIQERYREEMEYKQKEKEKVKEIVFISLACVLLLIASGGGMALFDADEDTVVRSIKKLD